MSRNFAESVTCPVCHGEGTYESDTGTYRGVACVVDVECSLCEGDGEITGLQAAEHFHGEPDPYDD